MKAAFPPNDLSSSPEGWNKRGRNGPLKHVPGHLPEWLERRCPKLIPVVLHIMAHAQDPPHKLFERSQVVIPPLGELHFTFYVSARTPISLLAADHSPSWTLLQCQRRAAWSSIFGLFILTAPPWSQLHWKHHASCSYTWFGAFLFICVLLFFWGAG